MPPQRLHRQTDRQRPTDRRTLAVQQFHIHVRRIPRRRPSVLSLPAVAMPCIHMPAGAPSLRSAWVLGLGTGADSAYESLSPLVISTYEALQAVASVASKSGSSALVKV